MAKSVSSRHSNIKRTAEKTRNTFSCLQRLPHSSHDFSRFKGIHILLNTASLKYGGGATPARWYARRQKHSCLSGVLLSATIPLLQGCRELAFLSAEGKSGTYTTQRCSYHEGRTASTRGCSCNFSLSYQQLCTCFGRVAENGPERDGNNHYS